MHLCCFIAGETVAEMKRLRAYVSALALVAEHHTVVSMVGVDVFGVGTYVPTIPPFVYV